MVRGDNLEERLINFVVRMINLCKQLPNDRAGNHIAGQLLRSGTSPAANYAEARNAESSKDFIHKLKIVLKELNESRIWLEIIICSNMQSSSKLKDIIQECTELCKITNASIITARNKQTKN